MDLKEYLESRKITVTEFSIRSRVGLGSLWHYFSGRRRPSQKTAEKIEIETNGNVTVMELRGIDDRKKFRK